MPLLKSSIKGHAAMLGANVMWGLMAPIAKTVMVVGVITPIMLANFRMIGACILFWVLSLFCPSEKVTRGDMWRMAGAAMLGIVFNQGCYVVGVSFTSPAEASIVTTTMPIWVMFLAYVILREPITVKKAGGIVLGASGALILVLGSTVAHNPGDNPRFGDILVLCAQLSYALYLTFCKNFIGRYSVVTLMKWMFTFSAIVSVPMALYQAPDIAWSEMTPSLWLGVAYVVVVATFLSYILSISGQKVLRPTLVGMYNYVQPLVAAVVSVYLGLDRFTPTKILAVVLIFSGVYLVTISKKAPEKEVTPASE